MRRYPTLVFDDWWDHWLCIWGAICTRIRICGLR